MNIHELLERNDEPYMSSDEIRELMSMSAFEVLHSIEDYQMMYCKKIDVRSRDHGNYRGNILLKKVSELHGRRNGVVPLKKYN